MNLETIKADSPLAAAAEDFFRAARAYRDAMKRHAPHLLGGVVFVRHENGTCIVYSESPKYTAQIVGMTHDRFADQLAFADLPDPDGDE